MGSCEECPLGKFANFEHVECIGSCGLEKLPLVAEADDDSLMSAPLTDPSSKKKKPLCPRGRYHTKMFNDEFTEICIGCGQVKTLAQAAAAFLLLLTAFCSQGQYQPSEGRVTCWPCPKGKFQDNCGQTDCITCDDYNPDNAKTDPGDDDNLIVEQSVGSRLAPKKKKAYHPCGNLRQNPDNAKTDPGDDDNLIAGQTAAPVVEADDDTLIAAPKAAPAVAAADDALLSGALRASCVLVLDRF
jgi:hypothetical protein